MRLTSVDFKHQERIPKRFTCDGEDISPQLSWSDAPEKTQSFVLIMDDPDAPVGTWVHWVLYDIPASSQGLPEDFPKQESFPNGARHGASWGITDFEGIGYGGPCPPPGRPHRYFFKLFALNRKLGIPPKRTIFELEKAMRPYILAQTELIGIYGR